MRESLPVLCLRHCCSHPHTSSFALASRTFTRSSLRTVCHWAHALVSPPWSTSQIERGVPGITGCIAVIFAGVQSHSYSAGWLHAVTVLDKPTTSTSTFLPGSPILSGSHPVYVSCREVIHPTLNTITLRTNQQTLFCRWAQKRQSIRTRTSSDD